MSDAKGPWHRDPPQRPYNPSLRLVVLIALIVVLAFGLWKLAQLFPGRANSDMDAVQILNLGAFGVLIASGLIFSRRITVRESLRNISLWTGIAAVLVLGYAYQDEIADAALRVRAELVPSYAVTRSPKELVITADENGAFVVYGRVDGARVKFMVDTGATDIVLNPEDARRLGIDLDGLNFTSTFETANGVGRGAPSTVESLEIGPIRLEHVPVSINEAPMGSSLLGMTFLSRLHSYSVTGRKLTLRAK
jgi:aspartyl protease family protein